MGVGERIRKRRKQLGWTQEELASKLGLTSKAAISTVENNKERLTTDRLSKYAAALKTTTSYLLGDTDNPEFIAVSFREEFNNIDQFTTAFNAMNEAREKIADSQEITDSEYQMLRVIYFALTPKNRTRIVGLMQQMLIEQKGGRDDD